MNYQMIRYFIGIVLKMEAALLVLPLIVALGYGEPCRLSFFITILISLSLGLLFSTRKFNNTELHVKDGFVTVALSWIALSLIGSLPFMLSGAIPSFTDAMFETVSGFTTTGSSILTDVEVVEKGVIFWRSMTHWIGGMGVLVFIMALIPLIGGGHNFHLMQGESPGPQIGKFVPTLKKSAMYLYGIYLAMTIIQIVLLLIFKMPWFDAVTLTLGTAGTGGFGIKNDSIASYTVIQQGIITVFMILFGVNFQVYFLILMKKYGDAFHHEEMRWYFAIIGLAILLIATDLIVTGGYGTVFENFHHSAFQVGSIITTTGYATRNFDLWPSFSKGILVILMFIGACAGSTGGGMKVSRIMIYVKSIGRELEYYLHPCSVHVIKLEQKKSQSRAIESCTGIPGPVSCYFYGLHFIDQSGWI